MQHLRRQRIGCYIKCGVQYERWCINNVKIPNIGITVGKWKTVGVYREWSAGADMKTLAVPQQEERWKQFVSSWSKLRSKWTVLMGDINICLAKKDVQTQHNKNMTVMKELIEDEILSGGWSQLVKDMTRIQKLSTRTGPVVQQSLLDHLYAREVDSISHIVTKNVTGYDHATIGCRLYFHKPPIKVKVIEMRKIYKVGDGEFQEAFLRTNF